MGLGYSCAADGESAVLFRHCFCVLERAAAARPNRLQRKVDCRYARSSETGVSAEASKVPFDEVLGHWYSESGWI